MICTNKIFLDENIYCLEEPLKQLGYIVSRLPEEERGMDDLEAFEYAQKQESAFITINGKHFVILVPPKKDRPHHFGIMWVVCQINKTMVEEIVRKIDEFLKSTQCIENRIIKIKRDNSKSIIVEEYYPKTTKINWLFMTNSIKG